MKYNFLKSYSKMNLFLNVGKKYKKTKLHNIQSLVFLINLYDEIKIKRIKAKKDKIKFLGTFAKHVKDSNNSILRALHLLRTTRLLNNGFTYQIEIKKKIPVFSGLGGGSSNAASLIKYFLKGKKFSKENLDYFSAKLGSDLRLFFHSNQIFQKDLKNIHNIKNKNLFYFIIVYPFLKCSTKEIYSKVISYQAIKSDNFNLSSRFKTLIKLKAKKNHLQKIVIKKFPIINKILKELKKTNDCQFSRLTGSGSACFGLFLTKKSAELGLKKIKKKFPKYWCVISKTI